MEFGLLLLRLAVGLTLAAHGAQKLFGWFGGYGLSGTGQFMESLGFSPGRRSPLMAGLAEAGGGSLLALGLATPLASAAIVGVMLVAIGSVHASKGFFAGSGGFELPLVLACAALSVAFTGPGALSLDSALGFGRAGVVWGVAALAAGALGGALRLLTRRQSLEKPQAHGA